MPKFVVYEVWTRSRVVEAPCAGALYAEMPSPIEGLDLCNWHVVSVENAATKDGLALPRELTTRENFGRVK